MKYKQIFLKRDLLNIQHEQTNKITTIDKKDARGVFFYFFYFFLKSLKEFTLESFKIKQDQTHK
jgi:hypothetical protein